MRRGPELPSSAAVLMPRHHTCASAERHKRFGKIFVCKASPALNAPFDLNQIQLTALTGHLQSYGIC